MTTLAAVYRRAADVRYRVLDGEAVVIRQRAGEVVGLNRLGARLFDDLDGTRTVGELVARVAADFPVDRTELERDVLGYLDELAAAGLIVPAGAGPATEPGR